MISFLFWNLGKQGIGDQVAQLVLEHDVDVLMLAECVIAPGELGEVLKQRTGLAFVSNEPGHRKVHLFTKAVLTPPVPLFDSIDGRVAIWRLALNGTDHLLALVHLQSKVIWSEQSQYFECTNLATAILEIEAREGHRRTILVGDLNMNPFEKGVVAAGGLHALMTRALAERESRVVAAVRYPYFYNPMWGCFGDRTEGPPGTHYYGGSEHVTYFWNTFDQVLVRPNLMHVLASVRILASVGGASLLSKAGVPNRKIGSDHLPLLFRMKL